MLNSTPTRTRRLSKLVLLATAMVAFIAFMPMAANAVHNEGLFELDGNIGWTTRPRRDRTGPRSRRLPSRRYPADLDRLHLRRVQRRRRHDLLRRRLAEQQRHPRLEMVVRQRLHEERHRARLRLGVHPLQRALSLLRRRPVRPDGRHHECRFLVPPERRRAPGRQRLPRCHPATKTFSGQHADGDLFVFAEFTGGGGDSAVSIYKWASGGPAPARHQNLRFVL